MNRDYVENKFLLEITKAEREGKILKARELQGLLAEYYDLRDAKEKKDK